MSSASPLEGRSRSGSTSLSPPSPFPSGTPLATSPAIVESKLEEKEFQNHGRRPLFSPEKNGSGSFDRPFASPMTPLPSAVSKSQNTSAQVEESISQHNSSIRALEEALESIPKKNSLESSDLEFIDSMIEDYLLFRGFSQTKREFTREVREDKHMRFQVRLPSSCHRYSSVNSSFKSRDFLFFSVIYLEKSSILFRVLLSYVFDG